MNKKTLSVKQVYSRALLFLALYLIFSTLMVYAVAAIVCIACGYESTADMSTAMRYIVNFAPMYLLGFPAYYLLARTLPPSPPQRHTMSPLQLLGAFACGVTMLLVGNAIGMGVNGILSLLLGFDTSFTGLTDNLFGENGYVFAMIAVLCAPLFEELICRKILIDRIRQYGDGVAILISGLSFGLVHGNLTQFFYAALIGSFFAFIYIRTGNILYTILLHTAVNFCGSVIPLLVLSEYDLQEIIMNLATQGIQAIPIPFLVYIVVQYSLVGIGALLLILGWKKLTIQPPMIPLPRKSRRIALLTAPGLWIFLVFTVSLFVLAIIGAQ